MNRALALFAIGFALFALTGMESAFAGEENALEQEALSRFAEYLRIDTTNPPGNEVKAAEFFKAIFDREGIEARIFESDPGRGNIYARLKGDGSKKAVVLLNHMDVVPANRQYWSVNPFSGMTKDGYLWGRGALDMKGMGLVELMAMLALKREGVPLKADVIFLGTADEEAGGAMGAGFMTREHFELIKNAGLVLNEGGFISVSDAGKTGYYGAAPAEKAPLWLKLTATGIPGHGSGPVPNSAVTRLIEALHRINDHQTAFNVEPMVQKFYADTADLDPKQENRERLKNLREALQYPDFAAEFTKDHWSNAAVRNTIAMTILEGSNKINVIPAEASAQLDVRLLPSQNPNLFIADLRNIIGDESIKIETILSFPPSASPLDTEFFKILEDVANSFDPGAKVTTPLLTGFTDCHFFREKGVPCYGFMPFKIPTAEIGGIHGNDERISVENLKLGARMMVEIVRRAATQ